MGHTLPGPSQQAGRQAGSGREALSTHWLASQHLPEPWFPAPHPTPPHPGPPHPGRWCWCCPHLLCLPACPPCVPPACLPMRQGLHAKLRCAALPSPHSSFLRWKKRRRYHSCQTPDSTHTARDAMLNHATRLFVSSESAA